MVNFDSISRPHASPASGVTVGQQWIGYPEVKMAAVEQLLPLTLKFSHQNHGIELLWIPVFQLQKLRLRKVKKLVLSHTGWK